MELSYVTLCRVDIKHKELPGNTMYMSGKSLYPLAISLAKILGEAIGEGLEISFSGGADKNNIDEIFEAGNLSYNCMYNSITTYGI